MVRLGSERRDEVSAEDGFCSVRSNNYILITSRSRGIKCCFIIMNSEDNKKITNMDGRKRERGLHDKRITIHDCDISDANVLIEDEVDIS